MIDETDMIPLCNDERTHLCYDATSEQYWIYAPTAGRKFPVSRTPEGAWKNWYTVLAHMTPDKTLKSIFLSAAASIKEAIPMNIVLEARHIRKKEMA